MDPSATPGSELASSQRELQEAQRELLALRAALRDTARGVQVLRQELEEKGESLRVAEAQRLRLAARFSHDLRTPVNAIRGLARLLGTEEDGPISAEQKKQVEMISRATDALYALIDEALSLARAPSGSVPLRLASFTVGDLWAGLRGTLPEPGAVPLIFEPSPELPQLETDEGKIAQVLRSFIANALRFTKAGEVRVRAVPTDYGAIRFEVSDTGIGIAREELPRLFGEFAQVDARQGGTGLGLSIAARLARLLAGDVGAKSEPGKGSLFWLTVPAVHPDAAALRLLDQRSRKEDGEPRILVLENDPATLLLYERYLARAGFHLVPARTVDEAREKLRAHTPAAVVLDVVLDNESTWSFLAELKKDARTADVPVAVVTVLAAEGKARALGADEFALKPVEEQWLAARLRELVRKREQARVLLVDDDESTRYLMRRYLESSPFLLLEAGDAQSGVELARREQPDVVLLDFFLPDGNGLDVVHTLELDPRTREIPVIIISGQPLPEQVARLPQAALEKSQLSREVALERIRAALEARKRR